jgi:hypothetical protein
VFIHLHVSLIFTCVYLTVLPYEGLAPNLARNYKARVEVTDSGKHSSLLRYGINFKCKKDFMMKACTIKLCTMLLILYRN